MNRRMHEKVRRGDAIDVNSIGRMIGTGFYELDKFIEEKDYCDLEFDAWIWSIGRRYSDGVIHASTGSELYQNPEYKCLWLR